MRHVGNRFDRSAARGSADPAILRGVASSRRQLTSVMMRIMVKKLLSIVSVTKICLEEICKDLNIIFAELSLVYFSYQYTNCSLQVEHGKLQERLEVKIGVKKPLCQVRSRLGAIGV